MSRLKTDYATSVAALFCNVAVRIMHETSLFWVTSADLIAKSRDNLPSWVPNWADGFGTPDPNNISWKIRLCHNASDMAFSVETPPGLPPKLMSPFEYFGKVANHAASLYRKTLRGTMQMHEDEFPLEISFRPHFIYHKTFHLDFQDSVARGITYSYYEPRIRDFTKVENSLRVPAQYCTKIQYVSEPIAPGLSNIVSIIKDLKAAMYKLFPDDWDYDLYGGRLDAIGRVLCFGVVMEQNSDVRLQGAWDDPNLAIMVHLLMDMGGYYWEGPLEDREDYIERHRDKFTSEIMGECAHCSVSTERPCQDCNDKGSEKPIPSRTSAWLDSKIQQAHRTVLQTAPGNCLLLTREGRLALGPPQTQAGDKVFILTGGLCPYILRRDETPKYIGYVTYQLIGDCYLDGVPKWDASDLEDVALV
ncbi:hypothetical protein G7Z17_g5890 [Cylindrodendrum hubeiense]|uniref:Uncharacterized protein n=1 Tax=Cylindrodendrum hubeiense TaxID=595255 RepID=A0A9P5HE58_9HYPO|nr:hypothetical protein G7Z17_g5890 [Cylindrodendrum hubeiense]